MLDFVNHFIGKTVVLHTNTHNMKMELLMTVKDINRSGKYAVVASHDKENTTIPMENVDVHVSMLDSQTSIDYVMSCFKQRKRYNKEPWILYVKVTMSNMHFSISLLITVCLGGANYCSKHLSYGNSP